MREAILNILEHNARISVHDLSIMLGQEEQEVAAAICEMEAERVICGYDTLINWDGTTAEKVTALIEVKVTPQRGMGFDRIAEHIYQYDEVDSVYLMSGAFDFTVIIQGKSMREVAQFVSDKLAPLEAVLSCATHFVLKKYKDHGVNLVAEDTDERMIISP